MKQRHFQCEKSHINYIVGTPRDPRKRGFLHENLEQFGGYRNSGGILEITSPQFGLSHLDEHLPPHNCFSTPPRNYSFHSSISSPRDFLSARKKMASYLASGELKLTFPEADAQVDLPRSRSPPHDAVDGTHQIPAGSVLTVKYPLKGGSVIVNHEVSFGTFQRVPTCLEREKGGREAKYIIQVNGTTFSLLGCHLLTHNLGTRNVATLFLLATSYSKIPLTLIVPPPLLVLVSQSMPSMLAKLHENLNLQRQPSNV